MPTDVSPPFSSSSWALSSSLLLFLGLLLAVGVGRLLEMRLSRRNQRGMAERGARRLSERGFGLMVGLHTGVLVSAAVEAWLCQRPFIVGLAIPAWSRWRWRMACVGG
jgi:isoprenylcysteine carboxyl methyltransferase (ICMT) family protein YpbQ